MADETSKESKTARTASGRRTPRPRPTTTPPPTGPGPVAARGRGTGRPRRSSWSTRSTRRRPGCPATSGSACSAGFILGFDPLRDAAQGNGPFEDAMVRFVACLLVCVVAASIHRSAARQCAATGGRGRPAGVSRRPASTMAPPARRSPIRRTSRRPMPPLPDRRVGQPAPAWPDADGRRSDPFQVRSALNRPGDADG